MAPCRSRLGAVASREQTEVGRECLSGSAGGAGWLRVGKGFGFGPFERVFPPQTAQSRTLFDADGRNPNPLAFCGAELGAWRAEVFVDSVRAEAPLAPRRETGLTEQKPQRAVPPRPQMRVGCGFEARRWLDAAATGYHRLDVCFQPLEA